jgi:hypothetical protein
MSLRQAQQELQIGGTSLRPRGCCFSDSLPLSRRGGELPQRGRRHHFGREIGTFEMTTFDKREEGFEKKYALDEEQKFKAEARRNKLLGLWVAEKLGLSGDEANAYAKEVVASDFEEAGDGDVVRKVLGDLAAKGVALTEPQLRVKMDELMAQAILQVKAGT